MIIGHALLHRKKIQTALNADRKKRFMNETTDIAMGAIGSRDTILEGVDAYMQQKKAQLDELISKFDRFKSADGPFGNLLSMLGGNGEEFQLNTVIDGLRGVLQISGAREFREKANQFLDSFFDCLPDITSDSVQQFVRREFDSLTQIYEQPFLQGQRTAQAHKGFKAAATLRNAWGPAIEKLANIGTDFNYKEFLLNSIRDVINRLDDAQVEALLGNLRSIFEMIAPLIQASASLSGSISVNIGGASGMPDPPPYSFRDDVKAAPETEKKTVAWIFDFITGFFYLCMDIWESVRTRNYVGRGEDGFFSVLLIAWQATRVIVRGFAPNAINKDSLSADGTDNNNDGKKVLNWFFTDEADLAINLFFRFLGSIRDMTQGAPSNWGLSFAMRMLKYYTNSVNMRAPYWWVRALKFFKDWETNGWTGSDSNRKRAEVPFGRAAWMMWGPMWFFSSIMGMIPSWEDFSLANGIGTARTLGPLITAIVVSLALGYVFLGVFSGVAPGNLPLKADWVTQLIMGIFWLLAMLAGIFILSDLESEKQGLAVGLFAAFASLIGVGLIIMLFSLIFWNKPEAPTTHNVGVHTFLLLGGLFLAIIMPFFSWWFYIQDGRDAMGVFNGMDAATSPYLLPYPQDENWLCGQGVHGIFSHLYSSPTDSGDNHYAYDFNEGENSPARAARDCIVMEVLDSNPNEKDKQNDIYVLNPRWVAGHDPGTDDERVITHSVYIHLSQGRAWTDLGHRLSQGYHLLDIDSTGISAQHHLHFHSEDYQRGIDKTVPVVFRDSSTHQVRAFFPLSMIPGKGDIHGKPLSFCYYISDNAENPVLVNPVIIYIPDATSTLHTLAVDVRRLGTAVTGPVTLFTTPDPSDQHFHSITLNASQIDRILRLKDISDISLDPANGHTHPLHSHDRRPGTNLIYKDNFEVQTPYYGHILAAKPGFYCCAGDQFVARINDRATEYFFFGAHRPTLMGEIAVDGGFRDADRFVITSSATSTATVTPSPNPAPTDVRGYCDWLNAAMQTAPPGNHATIAQAIPVIVIETVQRGSAASISIAGTALASLAAPARPSSVNGNGAFNNIRAVDRTQLVDHVRSILTGGWTAAPANLNVSILLDQVSIDLGGTATNFAGGGCRSSEVLTTLYDTAARRLRATGPVPMGCGDRIRVGGWDVPVAVCPARVSIDTTHAAFAVAALTPDRPLEITVNGLSRQIVLYSGDEQPARLAARICNDIEGVRAWAEGSAVIVETIASGDNASLNIRKQDQSAAVSFAVSDIGTGCPLTNTGGTPLGRVDLSCAMRGSELVATLLDAKARGGIGAPAAAGLAVNLTSSKLTITVASGHTLAVLHSHFTGGIDTLQLTASADSRTIESVTLSPTVDLRGPGFVDIAVDSTEIRIPFDASPARLEIGPLPGKFPLPGETLTLTVNGTASAPISIPSNPTSYTALADLLRNASTDITVRIAYTLSIERALHADNGERLELRDASGLALAGFLRDRAAYTVKAAGRLSDLSSADGISITSCYADQGTLQNSLASSMATLAGDVKQWTLDVQSGFDLSITASPVADPLGFANSNPQQLKTSATLTLPFKLECNAIDYVFSIKQCGTTTEAAVSRMQLSASPAIARAATPIPTLFMPDTADLAVTVIEPLSGGGERNREFTVNLRGCRTLADVAARIMRAVPLVKAWTVYSGPSLSLHIETVECGSGWKMRLGNCKLLYALGYNMHLFDWANDRIEFTGSGSVRNAAAVGESDITTLLDNMIQCTTGVPDAPGGAANPVTLYARLDGNNILCSSLAGKATIETRPTQLLTLLNAVESGNDLSLQGPAFSLDSGDILIKVGPKLVGVVHCYGERAVIRASQPLPTDPTQAAYTNMLALLKSHAVEFTSESGTISLTLPSSVTSIEDAIRWYAAHATAVWLAVESSGHLIVSSRARGSASSVRIGFTTWTDQATYPVDTILGFATTDFTSSTTPSNWFITHSGRGLFSRLDSVAASDLLNEIKKAADVGAIVQGSYDVSADTSATIPQLVARGRTESIQLRQSTIPPDMITFTGSPAREIRANYSGSQDLSQELITLELNDGSGSWRSLAVSLYGNPARCPALTRPSAPAVLNGKVLTVEIGVKDSGGSITWETPASTVTFTADSATTLEDLSAQIQHGSHWKVRCRVSGSGLIIESAAEGSAMALRVTSPVDSTAAITGNTATGFAAASPLPLVGEGSGSVRLVDEVRIEDYRDLLQGAFEAEHAYSNSSRSTSRTFAWSAYHTDDYSHDHAVVESRRPGCISSVVPIFDRAPAFSWKKQFRRAPAWFGSVVLPPITAPINQSGLLSIELNNNVGGNDLPSRTVIDVSFPVKAGGYSAADVAARINEELLSRSAGQAAAYADGSVVVETAISGISGSICIPAPGTGTGSNAALVGALLGTGSNPLRGRGWPGSGTDQFKKLNPGYRSKPGNAAANATWTFNDGTRSATVSVVAGETIEQVRDKVENALKPTSTASRMGICQIHEEDHCLYIAASGNKLDLSVTDSSGRILDAIDPTLPGQTPEREEEPACGLRRTHEIRTFYFCRDRYGQGNFTDMDESKWVRVSAKMKATSATTAEAGKPDGEHSIPGGRYWLAIRTDASKTTRYDSSGEMIASTGSAPGDYPVIHRARYFVGYANNYDGSNNMKLYSLSQTPEGRILADIIIGKP
jgi:hypothetical protein